jgi:hypothetical protein|tara:strand:- start:1243 stop:1518 length:276 start_codon:yes stop_codon:yes gene_type:complete
MADKNEKYSHWLLTLEIRDGEFEYTDRYVVNTREPRDENSAWKYITNEELDYLDFNDEEEGEAEDYNGRYFNIGIDPVETEHLEVLDKYMR